ncbi:MAG: hypothetical protein WBA46_09200, partial [Thermomicrobiales bacterium]
MTSHPASSPSYSGPHDDHDAALAETVNAIVTRFDAVNAVRDHAVGTGRQIVRLAANSVRALHREDHADASAM